MDPSEIDHRPLGEWSAVPSGFLDALLKASKFTGKHNGINPWTKYVYLVAGKLYATDNRCIVEIDLGDQSFGDGYFISNDLKLLRARGGDPCELQLNETYISFAWSDGTWCKVHRRIAERNVNLDHANQCRSLIQRFWHEGRSAAVMRKKVLNEVKREGREKILKFNRHDWHGGSIEKVMAVAESFDPDASPAPFSFPNGRGLIVKSSV